MHGSVVLLLAFALWTSFVTAQTLKYDWMRYIPSGAVVSCDGSRMAAGTMSSEGIYTITLYDGRTGQRLDTVVIDYTTTPKEYRAGVTFVDSTLVALVLKDGEEFRLVTYNERLQLFDTLHADLYHSTLDVDALNYVEISVNRLEGEFPKGVAILNFAINRVSKTYGSVSNTGATVFVDIHKDSSWHGGAGRMTWIVPSGDRTRMVATYHESGIQMGLPKSRTWEYDTVHLYDGETNTLISKTRLPRRDETFGIATVMGRSQTIVSGCQVWLGLIRDSIELSWGRIEELACESWISLSGNSKVVAVRNNVEKQRYELVVSDIYSKQLEVVDYWTSAFQPRVMMASSVAKAVYVAVDSNQVRRYAFHPSHQPTYAEWVDLNMKDTVKRFETVHIIGVANTRSRFRVDSIKSSGGTFKFSSNAYSISGTFFATTPGMHDVEMWCTTELDSITPIYSKRSVYVKDFNGTVCSFKTNFLLQNILVGQGKIVVSPGRSLGTSYVCPLDSLIDHNRFVPDTADLLSTGVVFYSDEQRAVLGRDCGNPGSGIGCLDIIEVDVSTNQDTKIGQIKYRNEGGWHGFPIQASGLYVQYAEVPGTDLRIVGVGPKFYDWGLDSAPYDVRKYAIPGKLLVRGNALIFVFNSSYQEYKDGSLNVANSIDSYPGSNVLLTMKKEKIEYGIKDIVAFETIDPLTREFKTEYDSVGLNVADAIRAGDSTYMTPRGIHRLMPTGELISIASFVERDGTDIVRINNSLSALIRRNTDTVATIYNHFTGDILQRLGSTHGLPRTGAYSVEHRMLFVGSDSGVVTGYDITRAVSVADESTSTIAKVAARYHSGVITVDVGVPIDEVSVYTITGEQVFNGALQDRPLQTSVSATSWMSGAYVVRVRSGQRWGTSKVAVVR